MAGVVDRGRKRRTFADLKGSDDVNGTRNSEHMGCSIPSYHCAACDEYAIDEERIEVAEAIRRSLDKIGLLQGVVRLLKSLELEHLKKEWDVVYGLRSELVHGLAPQPGKCYRALEQRAINLCGTILLTAVEHDIPGAARDICSTYPILPKPG